MPPYIIFQKQIGETPLQALERLRKEKPGLAEVKLAYAGRLDPMAYGALLVLIGDECKKVNEYNNLDKTYEFELLLGYESDTGDILGLTEVNEVHSISENEIKAVLASLTGSWDMQYPIFSSRPVNGVPLLVHAHNGAISDIDIPTKNVTIYDIKYKGCRNISDTTLHDEIKTKIQSLIPSLDSSIPMSNFRAPQILKRWEELRDSNKSHSIYSFIAHVSAGTYMRALAPEIAKRLNQRGLAYNIHRTSITL